MIRNRLKLVGAGIGVLAMVCSLSAVAGADEIVPDSSTADVTAFAHPVTMNVTLVGVDDPNWNGDDQAHTVCNIRTSSGAQYVKASVTSDSANATVSPAELEFTDCGQGLPITITGVACGSATIHIDVFDTKTAAPPHVQFSDASITVTVSDPSCAGGGTVGGISECAQPAAPAWAAAILKKNGVKANSKESNNVISSVAHTMLKGASFPDYRGTDPAHNEVAKIDQGAYSDAVWAYMKTISTKVSAFGPAASARPGWECIFNAS